MHKRLALSKSVPLKTIELEAWPVRPAWSAFSIAGIFILVGTLPYLSNAISQMRIYFMNVSSAIDLRFWMNLAEILI
jgi:hypothetical protein